MPFHTVVEQLLPGAGDPGPDGADGASGCFCRLLVGESDELGECERRSAVLVEYREQLIDLHPAVIVVIGRCQIGYQALIEASVLDLAASGVGANPAGNREQPRPGRTISTESMDGTKGACVGLLSEVLGIGRPAEVATHAEHVGRCDPHELVQCLAIARLRAQCCDCELVHQMSVPARNRKGNSCDNVGVDCATAQAEISESIDIGVPVSAPVEQHLDECPACRRWQEAAHQLKRSTLRSVSDVAPDEVTVPAMPRHFMLHRWMRVVLVWAGVLLVVWNVVGMFSAGSGSAIHFERHQAAFSVALGLAFMFVAWRPDRAYGMVPFAITFTFALSISAIIDLAHGASTFGRESEHLVELAGLGVLLVLGTAAGPGRRLTRSRLQRSRRSSGSRPGQ